MKVEKNRRTVLRIIAIILIAAPISIWGITRYTENKTKYEIGQILSLGNSPSKKEIIRAIPSQFEIGSDRRVVQERIFEIYPDFDPKAPYHNFNGSGGIDTYDYVEFYREDMYGIFFTFIYDENNALIKIQHEPF